MTFFIKKLWCFGFLKKKKIAEKCITAFELWEGKYEECRTGQVTDGIDNSDWITSEYARNVVMVYLKPPYFKQNV